jgi:DNA invertase Pin-like site-specific DNA recombinase
MIVGYARVSTDEQRLDLQLDALKNAGCQRIYRDTGKSGADFGRAGLERALRRLEAGDTLVVWRLDRLGRSLAGLVALMDELGRRGVHFQSLSEQINTASSGGRLMFHMLAALAEFERAIISERTRAGLSAARARGKRLGRPKLLDPGQITGALDAVQGQKLQMQELADALGVSPRTLRRYLHKGTPPAA